MARQNKRLGKDSLVEESTAEPSVNGESLWMEVMIPEFINRVENWIRTKLSWDDRDYFDRRQIATDIVYIANAYCRTRNLSWTIRDMTAMCSTITDRKIMNAIKTSRCKKNLVLLTFFGDESVDESMGGRFESPSNSEIEFSESFEHIWNLLNNDQKRVTELLTRDDTHSIQDIAMELETSASNVRRIRDSALSIAYKFLDIRTRTREPENQGTREPGNQGTREPGNQGTREHFAKPMINGSDYFEIFSRLFDDIGVFVD